MTFIAYSPTARYAYPGCAHDGYLYIGPNHVKARAAATDAMLALSAEYPNRLCVATVTANSTRFGQAVAPWQISVRNGRSVVYDPMLGGFQSNE